MEIGTEAAQFPEKEYINWIFIAVYLCQSTGRVSNALISKAPTILHSAKVVSVKYKYQGKESLLFLKASKSTRSYTIPSKTQRICIVGRGVLFSFFKTLFIFIFIFNIP
jgi:hypothetical protein